MVKIESKKVYVKLEPPEVIDAKRNVLESIAHLINMQIISKKLKRLSKDEVVAIEQEKIAVQEIIEDVKKLQEELPQKEKPAERCTEKVKVREATIVGKHISKEKRYRMELEDIKARLAKLGS